VNPNGFGPEILMPLGILGGLSWLLIVVGAVLLVIWAVRAFPGRPLLGGAGARPQPVSAESPLDTLARRFALGEITADEFEHARALLRGESTGK
jgi:uncharacterized membrane protein